MWLAWPLGGYFRKIGDWAGSEPRNFAAGLAAGAGFS